MYTCSQTLIVFRSNEMLTDHIKKSTHSLDEQTRLMCLLSLPVDQDYFKVLTQFATIKLDESGRIIVYKHGDTVIKCEHRKCRVDKNKNLRETTKHQENDNVGASSNHGTGTSTAPKTGQEKNNNGTPLSSYLSHNVKEEQHEHHSSVMNETSQLRMRTDPIEEEEEFTRPLQTFETPRVSNPRFSENSDSTSSSYAPRPQSIISTGEPILAEILQKLELYFLYKCKPELMPLCLRIKEIKENEATFSQKIVSPSTIRAFFEVSLRIMAATNVREPIKREQGEVQVLPLLLKDFFKDLKQQNLVEGLGVVIDDIQTRVGSQETISFSTISRFFLEIIDNLALVC
ncbi:hypothetical protein CAEBREN_10004 [Caenorhabditis brenneri]|uniref:SPK domain-containing protein n=1 Tax=Caenorhabditis brenneri TaxID=135651 RepID=G0N472_CAEBE|nr:hypothetical protein CAEBREN_10004 [Caenorhabditis brenneri]